MKKVKYLNLVILAILFAQTLHGQMKLDTLKTYVFKKSDGTEIMAKYVSQDMREFVLETKMLGRYIVSKSDIVSIREVESIEIDSNGDFLPAEVFNTRYFFTTNGLPIKKGDSYVLWRLLGPDLQFGVSKNLGVGIITTWLGAPAFGTIKYSSDVNKHVHVALGALIGSATWVRSINKSYLLLPYGALTLGNKNYNFNLSAGYTFIHVNDKSSSADDVGTIIYSLACHIRLTRRVNFIFDSFIIPNANGELINIWLPGIRVQNSENKAFQFALGHGQFAGESFPVPMVNWIRKL